LNAENIFVGIVVPENKIFYAALVSLLAFIVGTTFLNTHTAKILKN
jgi:hypothetical protein